MDNLYTILIVVVALGALLLLFKLLKTPLKIAVKLLLNGLMSQSLPTSFFTVRAPVGQTAAHWPQPTQLLSARFRPKPQEI